MKVEHVEFLAEEPSAAEALRWLAPKVLRDVSFEVHAYQGKTDLLGRLPAVLRGYARWLPATYRVVILVDRDDDECTELKDTLETIAAKANLRTRTAANGAPWTVVTRIAIEELEAWFFGDWSAVRAAYPRASAGVPRTAAHRHPDRIGGGTWEAFERALQAGGYFTTGLRKIEAARAVAEHMDPDRNSSPSFQALRSVLEEMAAA